MGNEGWRLKSSVGSRAEFIFGSFLCFCKKSVSLLLGDEGGGKMVAFRFAEAFYGRSEAMIFLQILGAIVIGFLVGGIARLIVPGRERGGCLTTILIGIGGSFVAFFIGTYVFEHNFNSNNPLQPAGFISSLLGAILILIIYHWIRRRRQP